MWSFRVCLRKDTPRTPKDSWNTGIDVVRIYTDDGKIRVGKSLPPGTGFEELPGFFWRRGLLFHGFLFHGIFSIDISLRSFFELLLIDVSRIIEDGSLFGKSSIFKLKIKYFIHMNPLSIQPFEAFEVAIGNICVFFFLADQSPK